MTDDSRSAIRTARRSRTLRKIREMIDAGGQVNGRPFLDGRYFVLLADERIVGCVGLRRMSCALSEIRHLVVLPEYRRRGFARALMDHAMDRSETPVLVASVRVTNEASLALFVGAGFSPTVRYGYDAGREPDHCLELLLRAAPRPAIPSQPKGGPDEDPGTDHRDDPRPDGADRTPQEPA